MNVPLDPREIDKVDELLADIDDGEIRTAVRDKMIAQLQADANERASDRTAYRKAFEAARDAGDPHPEITAEFTVKRQKLVDRHERRVRAIFKRAEDTSRKRSNKRAQKAETASKSAKPHQRRFRQRDRQYLEIVGKAEQEGWLVDEPLVLQEIRLKLDHYRLDHWEKTTLPLKVMAMSVESANEGAQTVNLRVNPDVCKRALGSPRGPASFMQDAIRRAFERTFGNKNAPDFWIVVETESASTFHLHGAVITPAVVNGRKLVDAALRKAGGLWAASGGQQHQQVSNEPTEPLAWASYVCKLMNLTGLKIDGKLMAASRGMTRRAAAGWDDLRRSLPQSPRADR